MPQKNYAKDLLTKIINDKLIVRMNVNPYRYRSLYEALTKLIESYNIRLITAAEIMEELVIIAHDLKKQMEQGKQLNLTDDELALYDLLLQKEKLFLNFSEIRKMAKEGTITFHRPWIEH